MRRVLLLVGLVILGSAAAVGLGQPPVAPPAPLVVPAAGTAPVPPAAGPAAETPLARFHPLDAYPPVTQAAVRAAVLGGNWLTRMNQPQGRFIYGYRPALRQPLEGDHDLRQARAALALAQCAKFTGDDRQAAVASQAILSLLAVTRPDPADPTCRVPITSSATCNRVGFAAVLALAIYELPGADEKLIADAERLCQFLHRQLRPDGSVHYTDGPDDVPTKIDPAGVNEYPGTALHALAVGNRVKEEGWKLDAVRRGLAHYRAYFKTNPHPMLAATLTPACTELHLQAKDADSAAAVFELTDWLLALQCPATDARHPLWAGGFKGWANGQPVEAEPGCECAAYVQALACACHLTRLNTDLARAARYRQAMLEAVVFVAGLQYTDANTRHFETTFRANMLVGGFYLTPTDGTLRVDATAGAVTGLLRFLASGAEK